MVVVVEGSSLSLQKNRVVVDDDDNMLYFLSSTAEQLKLKTFVLFICVD